MEELLKKIQKNVLRLIASNQELKQEVARLREIESRQREEILRTHEELSVLKREHKALQIANQMTSNSDENAKQEARKQINKMIALVDKVLQELKQ